MRPNFKLVQDFIVPSLEEKTYGNYLTWENRMMGCFKISRVHQSSSHFNQDSIEVYKDWSLKKNLWVKNDPRKITKAKHRLISALRRNPGIETLKKVEDYYRFRLKAIGGEDISCVCSEADPGQDSEMMERCKNEPLESVDHAKYINKKETFDFSLGELQSTITVESPSKFLLDTLNESDSDELIPPIMFADKHEFCDDNNSVIDDRCSCDRCSCVLLLDGSFLLNKMCILHGHFA